MDGSTDRHSATAGWMGKPMVRREDPALLRGAGQFVDDITPSGCLFLEVLRSTVSSGTITELDVQEAVEAPGVVAVFTAKDLGDLGQSAVNMLIQGAPSFPLQLLARGAVCAVGQPVAAIVATSLAAARDALELIVLEIEEAARTASKPIRIATWQSQARPPQTAVQVGATLSHARVAPMALEPRACLAQPQGAGGLRVWMSTQTPFRGRDDLARILSLPAAKVQVIAPDVGGAFGGKASLYPEDALTALAALRLQRPVKWTASRSDEFLAATQGRGAETSATLGCAADGRMLSLQADLLFPLGHWTPYSAYAPARNAARILPGPYDVPGVDVALSVQPSPTAPMNIYRGAGRPEAAMLLERLVDKAAHKLGLDPLAMRRANLRPASDLPGPGPTGTQVDSGDYPALLERLEKVMGYNDLRAAQAHRRMMGQVMGIGLALYIEPCGQGWETARIALRPDGRFFAVTGSSAQGQGRQTAWAQIAADELGVDPALVDVSAGDSADLPDAIGALASRSTAIGGSAMMRAAQRLRRQITAALADDLSIDAAGIVTRPDGLAAGGEVFGWAALAKRLPDTAVQAEDRFDAPGEAWASGAAGAVVSIDVDTGQPSVEQIVWIDDAGTVINPLLVQGQLWGGMAQGLGAVLSEQITYDSDGQLLTGSLMDYAVPRADTMPARVTMAAAPTPSAANPLGAKGVGEAGCIAIPPAVLNALQDAVLPFTDQDLPLPATPERLWRAIHMPEESQ